MRVPLGGKPDFTEIGEKQMLDYIDKVQKLMFSYAGVNDKRVTSLGEVLNDLHVEVTNRLVKAPFVEHDPIVFDHPRKVVKEKVIEKEPPVVNRLPKLRTNKINFKKAK